MTSKSSMIGSFIEDAPPGELADVVADVKALTSGEPQLLQAQEPAFKKYNEGQFATVKLPGSSQEVIVSEYNSLDGDRYYDSESQTSFAFDHVTQKASNAQSQPLESQYADVVKSLVKSFATYASEHFPSSSTGVYPSKDDSTINLVLVANKYSPNNFWNGRYRSSYTYTPTSNSLTGTIRVDVHYYEDGNVRLLTSKDLSIPLSSSGASASEITRQISATEKKYQEELNRAFSTLSEGAFKGLRRQLPVTRQKVEWDKIGGYRLGQDIGSGKK